jgi:hypothetical protein
MGISTPVPAVWLRPVSFERHSGAASQNAERGRCRANAAALKHKTRRNVIKNQEENHG